MKSQSEFLSNKSEFIFQMVTKIDLMGRYLQSTLCVLLLMNYIQNIHEFD